MAETNVPESRAYRHQACNGETVVGGQHFETMSDPLSDVTRTWCTTCDSFFPLNEFAWVDTNEKITDYYARHSVKATKLERFLCSKVFLLFSLVFGLVAGIVLAVVLFRKNGAGALFVTIPTLGVIGVVLFGSLNAFFLGKLISRRVTGVSDTRLLK